jgi:hypothetical protein
LVLLAILLRRCIFAIYKIALISRVMRLCIRCMTIERFGNITNGFFFHSFSITFFLVVIKDTLIAFGAEVLALLIVRPDEEALVVKNTSLGERFVALNTRGTSKACSSLAAETTDHSFWSRFG